MNDEQIALAGSIRESSDRLLEITGELLKMTQVEAGKLQLNPKITKPIELIDYAIKANRVQASQCGKQKPYVRIPTPALPGSGSRDWTAIRLISASLRQHPLDCGDILARERGIVKRERGKTHFRTWPCFQRDPWIYLLTNRLRYSNPRRRSSS